MHKYALNLNKYQNCKTENLKKGAFPTPCKLISLYVSILYIKQFDNDAFPEGMAIWTPSDKGKRFCVKVTIFI